MRKEDRKIILSSLWQLVGTIVKLRSWTRTNISQFHAQFRRAYKFDGPKKRTSVSAFRETPQSVGIWCGRNNRGSNEQRGNGIIRLRVNLRLTALTALTFLFFRVTISIKIAVVLLALHSKYISWLISDNRLAWSKLTKSTEWPKKMNDWTRNFD